MTYLTTGQASLLSLYKYKKPMTRLIGASLLTGILASTGCQSLKPTGAPLITTPPTATLTPKKLEHFMINGKIGITMPATSQQGAQAGSAFYAWGQQQDRFAIEIVGALGLGKTNIEFDGQKATLISEKTGTLTASNPESLLQKATGWQVPISQLPYWISGRPAPSDLSQQVDDIGRLSTATNGDWLAHFSYHADQTLPNKISVRHDQGHKVVMTIHHQTAQ